MPNLARFSFIPPKRAIRLPPQASGETKKVGGRSTACKSPISATNHQWGMKENPPLMVSLLFREVGMVEIVR
ncbi:hypothetical protein DTX80_03875 [Bacilli bacterium]|nr:hypothetical protein DTX80_03875 [Bacilli bacterium]RCO10104.1 hypothetical protein DTX79_06515 [Bacilli bacterium]RCT52624.1 hypothetical protein DEJ61_04230 [Bacilli bacterium]